MANCPLCSTASPVRVFWFSAIMRIGGSRLIEVSELIVIPTSASSWAAVTTATPVRKRPMVRRMMALSGSMKVSVIIAYLPRLLPAGCT